MKLIRAIAIFAITALVSNIAFAQAFPSKSVRLIVPYPPGGATDITARILAKALSSKWGQSVIVENRPGASGMIGADAVVKSKPDGYTLLVAYSPEVTLDKLFFPNMTYDPERDLLPITLLTSSPLVLVVHPSVPAKSVGELIALAKSKPGAVNYASPGIGGQQHLAAADLGLVTGAKLTHIPYKGTGPAMTDLLAGRVQMFFASIAPLLPHLRSGELVALGIADVKRSPLLPNVPTFSEQGIMHFEFVNWFGLLAPAGTPSGLIEQLNRDVVAVMHQEDTMKLLETQGLEVRTGTPKEFADYMREELTKYGKIARAANVKIE